MYDLQNISNYLLEIGMITGSQIRSARALLNWTRDELAAKCRVTPLTIKNVEDGKVQPHLKTRKAIMRVMKSHGVEFIERGVRWVDDLVTVLESV